MMSNATGAKKQIRYPVNGPVLTAGLAGVEAGFTLLNHNLTKAKIVKRPSRFVFIVEVNGIRARAHAPATSNIGGLELRDLPCLLSGPYDNRKTEWTVEAISPWQESHEHFQWVSINQTKMNRYIETAIEADALSHIFGPIESLRREVATGSSRIDFLVNDTFVEVKTPLTHLEMPVPCERSVRKPQGPGFPQRMIRQLDDIAASGKTGVLLSSFCYDAYDFEPQKYGTNDWLYHKLVELRKNGISFYQYTMNIDESGVYSGRLREMISYG